MIRNGLRVVPLLFAIVGVSATAGQQAPVFRSGTALVPIYVTVRHDSGRLVTGLRRDQFRVLEDGREREILAFSNESQPITAVLLLDTSSSMSARLQWTRSVATHFVDSLQARDRLRIGSFGTEISLSPHLTGDVARLKQIVRDEIWPGGGTPIWHAINAALDSLRPESGRRVVLVVGDGAPSPKAGQPPAELKARCEAEDVMVYAVSSESAGMGLGLRALAADTGGGHFIIPSDENTQQAVADVAEELRRQYVLGVAPASTGGRHALTVRVTEPDMKSRARRAFPTSGR